MSSLSCSKIIYNSCNVFSLFFLSCLSSIYLYAMPTQGHEGLFDVDHKYDCNSGFEGLTLGRSEPMEYSFMTAQSSNTLPGDSKGFSYNTDTQQGFDSPFWLGKDSLMQNMTGRNQVPTVCVWCRNEFYQDPATSGSQTGAIGSICPACNSKISQQFNVL